VLIFQNSVKFENFILYSIWRLDCNPFPLVLCLSIYGWLGRRVILSKMTRQEKLSVHSIVHLLLYKFDKILIFLTLTINKLE